MARRTELTRGAFLPLTACIIACDVVPGACVLRGVAVGCGKRSAVTADGEVERTIAALLRQPLRPRRKKVMR